ncbi:MAG: hypothetical protein MJZ37_00360 [Bacilli bacterium]|nr:hypothetical protein [Bacilli bacterium]
MEDKKKVPQINKWTGGIIKRDDNEHYITLTMRVERTFQQKIRDAARSVHKTQTAFILDILRTYLDGGYEFTEEVDTIKELKKIDKRLSKIEKKMEL